MVDEIRVTPAGFVSDPSRIVSGGSGLTVAENVFCNREGLVVPRARLEWNINADAKADNRTTRYAREWDSEYWFSAEDETDTKVYRGTNAASTTLPGRNLWVRGEASGRRQFWTFKTGVRMLDSPTSSTAFQRFPGAEIPEVRRLIAFSTGSATEPAPLDPQEQTAYRLCRVIYVGPNRIPVRSAPTSRFVIYNTGAVNRANVSIDVLSTFVGDTFEVYRTISSVASGADPGDEMVLVRTFVATSVGVVNIVDASSQTIIGAPLYTNVTQEGPDRANFSVRTAYDVSDYKQRLFYAGATAGHRASMLLQRLATTLTPATSDELDDALISVRSAGTHTNGSAVITGVTAAAFAYLRIGQVVTGWSTTVNRPSPADPTDIGNDGLYGRITFLNSGAGTVTLDTAATAADTTFRFVAWDWVGVDFAGSPITAPAIYAPFVDVSGDGLVCQSEAHAPGVFAATIANVTGTGTGFGAGNMVTTWNSVTSSLASPYSQLALLAEAPLGLVGYALSWTYEKDRDAGGTFDWSTVPAFAMISSKPLAYTVPVALTFAASPPDAKSNVDGGASDLWWSKSDQPEAVPLGNRTTIGDPDEKIVRIIATTDRLWIFKTDGLYTAYGDGDLADSIVVQLVDPTCRMIDSTLLDETLGARCPQWCAAIRDTVFAWTRGGIVAIDSSGVRHIDGPIRELVQSYTPGFNATGSQTSPLNYPWMAHSIKDGFIVFGMSKAQFEPDPNGIAFCYHVDSGTWSRWIQTRYLPHLMGGAGNSELGEFLCGVAYGYVRYYSAPNTYHAFTAQGERPITGDTATPRAAGTLAMPTITAVVGDVATFTGTIVQRGDSIIDSAGNFFYALERVGPFDTQLDRTGAATGLCLEHVFSKASRFAFPITTLSNDERHFLDLTFGAQLLRSGYDFTFSIRPRGKDFQVTATHRWPYLDEDGVNGQLGMFTDVEFDTKWMTPRRVSRARGIEITVTHEWARSWFEVDQIIVRHDEAATRIAGAGAGQVRR